MNIQLLQINYRIGDLEGNSDKIIEQIKKGDKKRDLIICSELAITGYPPLDLLIRKGFVKSQNREIGRIREALKEFAPNSTLALGVVTESGFGKGLQNSMVLIKGDGGVDGIYHKRLLPTYNIFDEERLFSAGNQSGVFKIAGERVAFYICEDLWHKKEDCYHQPEPLATDFENEKNIDLIVSINASPSNVGKLAERVDLARDICTTYSTPLLYLNQIGGNDDLLFDGNSFIMNSNGEVAVQMAGFIEESITVDMNSLKAIKEEKRYSNRELLFEHLKLGIKDYVQKCGAKGVLISSSGGIDSAVVMAMAVEALGCDFVEATTMPSEYSSAGSVDDSAKLCENLNIPLYTFPIAEDMAIKRRVYKEVYGKEYAPIVDENYQARIRGANIMARSNDTGYLVLATGNKSEMSVGYFTLYGDSNGALAPLGDLFKMEVYDLAKHINQRAKKEIIPQIIIDKEPSAELAPDQKDSDSLPEYHLLDAILKLYIEGDLLRASEYKNLKESVENSNISKDELLKIINLVDKNEFKRRQTPIIIRCQRRSFGPGRRLPVAQKTPFVWEM